jgi:hypothetical protein
MRENFTKNARIWDPEKIHPGSGIRKNFIPDPGGKKAPDPGFRSPTLISRYRYRFYFQKTIPVLTEKSDFNSRSTKFFTRTTIFLPPIFRDFPLPVITYRELVFLH